MRLLAVIGAYICMATTYYGFTLEREMTLSVVLWSLGISFGIRRALPFVWFLLKFLLEELVDGVARIWPKKSTK